MSRINGTHDLEFPIIKYRHPQVRSIALALHGRAFVAGGAARAMAHAIPFSDIDLFCLSEDNEEGVAYDLESVGYIEEILPDKTSCRVFVPPAETHKVMGTYVNVQLIRPVSGRFGTPIEVMEKFGFFCEQFAYDSRHLMSSFEADRDVRALELHINADTNSLDLAWRINKYGKKGFTISRQEVVDLFQQWDGYTTEEKLHFVDQQSYSVDNSGQSL